MRRGTFALAALIAAALFLWMRPQTPRHPPATDNPSSVESMPVSSWRDPQRDLMVLFPGATNYIMETRILSGRMVSVQKRLGRPMNVDENPLRVFHPLRDGEVLGSVLLCRAKGEHGAIELVIGVETNGMVRGVMIQSQREPESVAHVITSASFLGSFGGKDVSAPLRLGDDLPAIPLAAHNSGQSLADAVRSELIVLSSSEPKLGNGAEH